MFDDQQQTTQNDNLNIGTAPNLGLGTNPTNDGTGVISTPTTPSMTEQPMPQVTLPNQDQADNADIGAAQPSSDLDQIKQQAIQELSPLVDKLDQTPEERYKTLIMLIQSTDNEELIPEAYKNAQKITDDKTRAEALLNIVNEINYLTNSKK